jgi:hypothetical protein
VSFPLTPSLKEVALLYKELWFELVHLGSVPK